MRYCINNFVIIFIMEYDHESDLSIMITYSGSTCGYRNKISGSKSRVTSCSRSLLHAVNQKIIPHQMRYCIKNVVIIFIMEYDQHSHFTCSYVFFVELKSEVNPVINDRCSVLYSMYVLLIHKTTQ